MRNVQNSPQLVAWAINRVLELRANRIMKKYLPKDAIEEVSRFSGWSRCAKCGTLFKSSCRSCNNKIVRAHTLKNKSSKLSERDKLWNDIYKGKKKLDGVKSNSAAQVG